MTTSMTKLIREVMTMSDLHPGLILIATGLLALIMPAKISKWVAAAGPFAALAAMVPLDSGASLTYRFTGSITMDLLHVDTLAWVFGMIFCVIASIIGVYSFDGKDGREKCASLIYAGSAIAVVFAGDWISLICFWEVMAISSTYLVWAGKTHQARRASYRYLAMHFFGGNMLLAGAVAIAVQNGWQLEMLTGGSGWAYWFVLIGLAVNGAVPPLHTWVSDAYPEATAAGTVYMGSYTTKVALYALIRLFAGTQWLVFVGAAMAVFAACMALMENDIKRLLSYHIVSQLGMMVAALGTGSAAGIDGAALHAIFNILYKGVLLMGAGAIVYATGTRKISQLGGLYKKMPLVAACFFIASLSIAGVPFFSGFASKALITEALHAGHFTISYWLVTLAGVGTWLSITLKINYFVFFREPKAELAVKPVPSCMKAAMVMGTVLCVLTGLFPSYCYELMPNAFIVHPFNVEHIVEYAALFVGATVPFVRYIKKMEPHDVITLDFDWIYRIPLMDFIVGVSQWVNRIFARFEHTYYSFEKIIKTILRNPSKVFGALELDDENVEEHFEEQRPVGEFMQTFIVFCVIAFLVLLIIE